MKEVEVDSKKSTLEVTKRIYVTGPIISNYLRFSTGDYNGMTISTKTDAEVDAGLTLTDGTVTESAWVGDSAAAITLPSATLGTLVVWIQTATGDGGSAITFTCAGSDTFHTQSLNIPLGEAVGSLTPRVFGTSYTPTQALDGGITSSASSDASVSIAITTTATNNNWGTAGSQIAFYCDEDSLWRVAIVGRRLGSGDNGTDIVFT